MTIYDTPLDSINLKHTYKHPFLYIKTNIYQIMYRPADMINSYLSLSEQGNNLKEMQRKIIIFTYIETQKRCLY